MTTHFKTSTSMSGQTTFLDRTLSQRPFRCAMAAATVLLLTLNTGCGIFRRSESAPVAAPIPVRESKPVTTLKSETLTLREGDVLKISFPSASNLDAVQTIRRDGKLSLALIGEVQAAGLSPTELQAELIRLYAPQLVTKEIIVTVVTANFSTFVSGAVLRPGKITTDHALTVLEAIMEAGGPDFAKANLKTVTVIRKDENGRTENFTVNVKSMMDGSTKEPFFLKPSDIVIVPERFAVF